MEERKGHGGLKKSFRPPWQLLRGSGTIGGAGAFALAAVLACMLRIAAALPLTVILALAGVLGWRRSILGEQNACRCGGCASRLGRLCVQTSGGATEQTCKCGGQSERLSVLHDEINLSIRFGHALVTPDVDLELRHPQESGYTKKVLPCSTFEPSVRGRLQDFPLEYFRAEKRCWKPPPES